MTLAGNKTMKAKIYRSKFDSHTAELLLVALLVVLLIFCDVVVFTQLGLQPASEPVQETEAAPKIPNDSLDSLTTKSSSDHDAKAT